MADTELIAFNLIIREKHIFQENKIESLCGRVTWNQIEQMYQMSLHKEQFRKKEKHYYMWEVGAYLLL